MALTFDAELTPAQVREATLGIFRKQATKPVVLAGVVGLFWLAQLILWVLLKGHQSKLQVLLLLLMLATMGFLYLGASRHYVELALQNFKRFHGAPAKVRLDEEAYHYAASWGTGSVPWGLFQSLWCFKNVWVLLQHSKDGVSVLLPAAALDEEARAFVRRKMAEVQAQVQG